MSSASDSRPFRSVPIQPSTVLASKNNRIAPGPGSGGHNRRNNAISPAMTLQEIADVLGEPFEEIRDIYRSALKKLSHGKNGRRMLELYELYESERSERNRCFATPYARTTRRAIVDVPFSKLETPTEAAQ